MNKLPEQFKIAGCFGSGVLALGIFDNFAYVFRGYVVKMPRSLGSYVL
jgi:hypothetical protein